MERQFGDRNTEYLNDLSMFFFTYLSEGKIKKNLVRKSIFKIMKNVTIIITIFYPFDMYMPYVHVHVNWPFYFIFKKIINVRIKKIKIHAIDIYFNVTQCINNYVNIQIQ